MLRFAYGAAYNAGCKRISYGGQVVRDAVVATVAWRVVIASVNTAYGARLVGYVLVPAHRVFLHGDAWRCLIFFGEAASCMDMAGSTERSLRSWMNYLR